MIVKCPCNADPAARWVSPAQNIYVDQYRSDGSKYRCFAHLSERRRGEIEAREKGRRHTESDELEGRCAELEEEIGELSADRDELEEDRDRHAGAIAGCGFELDGFGRGLTIDDRDLATARFFEMLAKLDTSSGDTPGAKWQERNPVKSV